MIASQQKPTKEGVEEEAEEEEEDRIQYQEEGLRGEEVSAEYSTVFCTHLTGPLHGKYRIVLLELSYTVFKTVFIMHKVGL